MIVLSPGRGSKVTACSACSGPKRAFLMHAFWLESAHACSASMSHDGVASDCTILHGEAARDTAELGQGLRHIGLHSLLEAGTPYLCRRDRWRVRSFFYPMQAYYTFDHSPTRNTILFTPSSAHFPFRGTSLSQSVKLASWPVVPSYFSRRGFPVLFESHLAHGKPLCRK